MKSALFSVIILMLTRHAFAETTREEDRVREVVKSFYADFNSHGWAHAVNYTTKDWVHINPLGGSTHGRDAVLKELEEVHSTFLKGVSDTIQDMAVSFATEDVAIATVVSQMSTFKLADSSEYFWRIISDPRRGKLHGIECYHKMTLARIGGCPSQKLILVYQITTFGCTNPVRTENLLTAKNVNYKRVLCDFIYLAGTFGK